MLKFVHCVPLTDASQYLGSFYSVQTAATHPHRKHLLPGRVYGPSDQMVGRCECRFSGTYDP